MLRILYMYAINKKLIKIENKLLVHPIFIPQMVECENIIKRNFYIKTDTLEF